MIIGGILSYILYRSHVESVPLLSLTAKGQISFCYFSSRSVLLSLELSVITQQEAGFFHFFLSFSVSHTNTQTVLFIKELVPKVSQIL